MKGKKFILGQTYIFTFIGEGIVKSFHSTYTKVNSQMYGSFDCGLEVRIDNHIDTNYLLFFNITDSRLNDYIHCSLYVFTSKEKMEEILPAIIQQNLDDMKLHSDVLMQEYMKLVDGFSSMEQALNSFKKQTFKITNL